MKATTPTAPQVSTSDVVQSFCKRFALCLMYVLQSMAKAFGMVSPYNARKTFKGIKYYCYGY